jgi:hypothetical protein
MCQHLSLYFFPLAPLLGSSLPYWSTRLIAPFLDLSQTVGLLGRVISSSQGLYLNTGQYKHRKTRTYIEHPCPRRDSKPQSRPLSDRRLFMPQTARLPRPTLSLYSRDKYFHVSGVCVTNKTCFGFDDRIYWSFIELATTVHKSVSDTLSSSSTGHSRLLATFHYSTTPLYSVHLLTVPSYNSSARTSRKTPSSLV